MKFCSIFHILNLGEPAGVSSHLSTFLCKPIHLDVENINMHIPSTLLSTSAQYTANTFESLMFWFPVGNTLGCQKRKFWDKDITPLSPTCECRINCYK